MSYSNICRLPTIVYPASSHPTKAIVGRNALLQTMQEHKLRIRNTWAGTSHTWKRHSVWPVVMMLISYGSEEDSFCLCDRGGAMRLSNWPPSDWLKLLNLAAELENRKEQMKTVQRGRLEKIGIRLVQDYWTKWFNFRRLATFLEFNFLRIAIPAEQAQILTRSIMTQSLVYRELQGLTRQLLEGK